MQSVTSRNFQNYFDFSLNLGIAIPPPPSSTKLCTPPQPDVRHVVAEAENPNETPQRPISPSRGSRLRQQPQLLRNGSGPGSNNQPNKDSGTPVSPIPRVFSPKCNQGKSNKIVLATPRLDTG